MSKKIVIAHFYNEEYMLPYWIKHHRKMFDHGVMINNGSTDNSVEIIKALAPEWEIIDSGLNCFDPLMLDFIVQKNEERFNCWKICLNITEYIWGDIDKVINDFEARKINAISTRPIVMIDNKPYEDLDPSKGLIVQKPWGIHDGKFYDLLARDKKIIRMISIIIGRKTAFRGRSRLLHCLPIGGYTNGRHNWYHDSVEADNLYILWYGYSPWTKRFIDRKKSFKDTLPETRKDLGKHHSSTVQRHNLVYWANKIYSIFFGLDVKELNASNEK